MWYKVNDFSDFKLNCNTHENCNTTKTAYWTIRGHYLQGGGAGGLDAGPPPKIGPSSIKRQLYFYGPPSLWQYFFMSKWYTQTVGSMQPTQF